MMNEPMEEFADIVQLRFDRVFDVQGATFSFESGGKKHYSVSFIDGPAPREGSRYAIALAREGDWSKVAGWRDLSTPNVVLTQSPWDVAREQAWGLYWFGPLFIGGALLMLGGWAALAVLLAFVWASVYFVRRARRRNRLIDQALRAIAPAAPPGPPPDVPLSWRRWATGVLSLFSRFGG